MKKTIIISIAVFVVAISGIFLLSCSKGKFAVQSITSKQVSVGDKVLCPVLKTKFTVKKDSPSFEYKGKKFFVCCPECLENLKQNPTKYLSE